jgi:hypothetical protein
MRTYSLLLSVFVSLIASFAFCESQEEVNIGVTHVFVPTGFDSNDHVEVITTGMLPNTCYVRPQGIAKVAGQNITINVKATKLSGENVACIQAVVPYMISVSIGQLNEGTFAISVNTGNRMDKYSAITIERANSTSINNFTYANVTHITQPHSKKLTIHGVHPSSCMDIDRVEILSNETNDTYSILPIVKQIRPVCDMMMKPFVYHVELPGEASKEQLAHVRKIDGTAVNFILTH